MFVHPSFTLERQQRLPLDLRQVFAFFADPGNLPRITPPWLGFRILTPPPLVMRRGLTVDYHVRVAGIRVRWRSEITEYDPPHRFRDVQLAGPYRRWDHEHRFWEEDGQTVVHDRVVYEPPLGPLGHLLNAAMITRQLAAIFDYRRARIAELLPSDRGAPASDDALPASSRDCRSPA